MGERSGKILLGLVLLIVGTILFLDQFGIHLGSIIKLLIPGLIMVYGAKKILSPGGAGSKGLGIFVFLLGLLMLVGKLHVLFSSLLAVGIIYAGYCMLRRRSIEPEPVSAAERQWAKTILKEDMIDRFEQEIKARKQSSL